MIWPHTGFFNVGTNTISNVFSESPVSRNVSEGSAVEFSCATPHGATVTLTWSIPGAVVTSTPSDLPGGVKKTTASFMATASNNNTDITCIADGTINGSSVLVRSSKALLLVQGINIKNTTDH